MAVLVVLAGLLVAVLVGLVAAATARTTGLRALRRQARPAARDARPRRQRAGRRPVDVAAIFRRRQHERRTRAQARRPRLPADDVPPAGLSPLVPSPRTLGLEAARGIRELEDWLAGRASSA